MNDDYLWDKNGQPDAEIQQLEEILGTLRYRPKPFEIPRELPALRRRSYFPVLAIAATLLLTLLAGGLWLRVRTHDEVPQQHAKLPPTPAVEQKMISTPEIKETRVAGERSVLVKRRNRSSSSGLAKREREEALAVKQQLMLALRLASEKLNLAHKKTQNTSPANQIKNQHRVG